MPNLRLSGCAPSGSVLFAGYMGGARRLGLNIGKTARPEMRRGRRVTGVPTAEATSLKT